MNWQPLVARLCEIESIATGKFEVGPVAGGDINRAYRLDLGGRRYFVKTNDAERLPMFEAEMASLAAIRASGAIRTPDTIFAGCVEQQAYLVLSFIEFGRRPDATALALALAAMHRSFGDRFGFACDNTIGSTPQPNAWMDDWVEFWRQRRLEYQLDLAARNGFDRALLEAGGRLAERLDAFFIDRRPRPSLLHGDLWSGNQGADAAGKPVIFDPACYYGDHETDLAMMELFGAPGERFFASYRECFPIDEGYAERRELYNLYHLLNHANLFGGGYAAQALRVIQQLLATL